MLWSTEPVLPLNANTFAHKILFLLCLSVAALLQCVAGSVTMAFVVASCTLDICSCWWCSSSIVVAGHLCFHPPSMFLSLFSSLSNVVFIHLKYSAPFKAMTLIKKYSIDTNLDKNTVFQLLLSWTILLSTNYKYIMLSTNLILWVMSLFNPSTNLSS